MPVLFSGWSFRPEIGVRDTVYTEKQGPQGQSTSIADPVNRWAVEGSFELRPPAVSKVFDKEWLGRKWKHVIEPRAVYSYVTGVNNFPSILRFDERDVLSNTNEVEYAVVNRLFAKRTTAQSSDCADEGIHSPIGQPVKKSRVPWEKEADDTCQEGPVVREVVSWELAQKYFLDQNFGNALVAGQRNVFTTTVDLTGIAFLTDPRRFSPLISRLRVQTTSHTDAEWDLDYDFKKGLINASTTLVNYHIGQITFGAGDAYMRTQGEANSSGVVTTAPHFNQFRLLLGYGGPNKRGLSVATNVGFDATLNFLQYASVQTAYNWDCCGVNIEYRRFALGSVRNENQFRFTFALANVGAFGNLRRQERLF